MGGVGVVVGVESVHRNVMYSSCATFWVCGAGVVAFLRRKATAPRDSSKFDVAERRRLGVRFK